MKMALVSLVLFASLACLNCQPAHAQDNPKDNGAPASRQLTLDRIFSSGEFHESGVGVFSWSESSPSYFTIADMNDGSPKRGLFRIDCKSGDRTVIATSAQWTPGGSESPLDIQAFQFSKDEKKILIYTNSQRVWRQNTRGDYWLLDLSNSSLRQLGGSGKASTMMFAKLSPDGQMVAFVRENNLYVQSLADDTIQQLTTDGSSQIINGTADWVNEEELDIRDGFRWSPDGQQIVFWQFNTEGVPVFTMLDNTSELYPKLIQFPYPKVGQRNSATRLGVVNLNDKKVTWMQLPGDPREHYIARAEWIDSPSQSEILVQQLNRLQNQNHVFRVNARTGAAKELFVESDECWLENENPIRWIEPGKSILWVSERDGWRHAYRLELDRGTLSLLTTGEFDLIQIVAIDRPRGWLYFIASPDNATQGYLYKVGLNGGTPTRITPKNFSGWNSYNISPDGLFAIHTWSDFVTPPRTELIKVEDHSVVRRLADNSKVVQALKNLDLPTCEFFKADIGVGYELDGWCIKPPNFKPDQKYPLMFYVYGEPFGQTVRDAWQGDRGLWHMMLAQQGYIVVSIDNRGTMVPRGRAWRKCIYRQVGILASADQASATRWLIKNWPFIDEHRIGIWGWSGGGSMSLNAIFRYPDLYKVAVAVAPVPDETLYDTIYQERYMGLPDSNSQGYRDGSPITHAKNLKGDLMVIHGTGDDNCHYQGVERLINELVSQNKLFTVMPYPGRSHSIHEGQNTVRHFFSTITAYLHRHLMQRPTMENPPAPSATDSTLLWQSQHIQGWKVQVSRKLIQDQPKELSIALNLLESQLKEIVAMVPAKAVERLRTVTLWFSPEYPGVGPRAEYHPGRDWLVENGREPAMAKGVEFTNVGIFEAEVRRMPNFVLHELAHAYHDQVLSFEHAEISDLFLRAKSSGRYDKVKRQDSQGRITMEKAYAMTNPIEYFAETTEAFFGKNDFQPFHVEELRSMDPAMNDLLGKVWALGAQ